MGVTARVPRRAAPGKARIGESGSVEILRELQVRSVV